jgi:glutamate synthase (NADPH/NADH) small chain
MKAWNRDKAATPIWESKKAVVIGGGNVAMDASRMALRLGAESVHILYRRTRTELPARLEEIAHAEEEGVVFNFLLSPIDITGDANGHVTGINLQVNELGEPDDSGRRRPVPIPGKTLHYDCDMVIPALGNDPNPLLTSLTEGLAKDKRGRITVDAKQKTSLDRVYAGGDIVQGAATVILAMGDGRRAAAAMKEMFK